MDEIFHHLEDKKVKAITEINRVLDEVCAETMLCTQVAQLLTTSEQGNIGDGLGKHSAMVERMAKLAIPKFGVSSNTNINSMQSNQLYPLLEDILNAEMFEGRPSETGFSIVQDIKSSAEIVRGNAYPEQTATKIKQIQGKYDSWYEIKVGISPSRVLEIIGALVPRIEGLYKDESANIHAFATKYQNDFNEYVSKDLLSEKEQAFVGVLQNEQGAYTYGYVEYINQEMCHLWPANLEKLKVTPVVTGKEANAFKTLFAVGKSNIEKIKHIQRKPFYQLLDGRVLFGDLSNAYDVIFDEFEAIAKQDNKFYSKSYQKYKSNWLEQKTYEHLCCIFPKEDIFQSLCYPDPDTVNGNTELDLAVKWGPFLLVVEAKAKQFRFEGRVGDKGRLRTDIVKNVKDAFEQTLRVKCYIKNNLKCQFKEKKSGRELCFNSDDIKKIFPISITFNHLADIATRLDELGGLNLFTDCDYPFCICESDFELLTKAEITPDIFLHYIQRRIELLNDNRKWIGDEVDLFSAYLDCRLIFNNMVPDDDQDINTLCLSGYSTQYDELMAYERKEYPNKPDLKVRLPENVDYLFNTLRSYDDDGGRWIAFALLALDDKLLSNVTQLLLNINLASLCNGAYRTMTYFEQDTVISIVGTRDKSFKELRVHMAGKALLEKYRYRAKKSIVIGVQYNSKRSLTHLFDTADYVEFDWHFDEAHEQLLAALPKSTITKKIGRNELCICGSGKKFKKCCINRMQ